MDILKKIEKFYASFPLNKGIMGKSGLNQPINYFKVIKTPFPKIIVQGSIHAREHITSHLVLKLIEHFRSFGKNGTIYFIPAVNVDGIKIAIEKNPLYKANAFGVDLNVNFDALWGMGDKNVFSRADENFVGNFAFSEKETQALRDFTLKVKPDMTISYHSKGEEIYFEFLQEDYRLVRDYKLAKAVSDVTGYAIKSTPFSCGGYKDWCINQLKIPSLTIEVGKDSLPHPIGKEHLEEIFKQNKDVLTVVIDKLMELKCKKSL